LLSEDSKDKKVKSFLPVDQVHEGKNFLVSYTSKAFKISYLDTIKLLKAIFDAAKGTKLLCPYTTDTAIETFRINESNYSLYIQKNLKYYRCNKCKKITLYNINNVCPHDGCDGVLSECNPEDIFKDNYYRENYKNKKFEYIDCEEHTSQIEKAQAKKYQDDFKNKKINILNSSTTFEMGIDLGSLTTVFMRNVPPKPSNYVQRAGRAGRSVDTPAFIITFCSLSSHDFTYFDDPRTMIRGIVRPPSFKSNNTKILLRHIRDICLGHFFTDNKEYFQTEKIIDKNTLDLFKKYISSNQVKLNEEINKYLLDDNANDEFYDFKWNNDKFYEPYENFINETNKDIENYKKGLENARQTNNSFEMNYYNNMLHAVISNDIISRLASNEIIPSYGFPIANVKLNVLREDNSGINEKIKLERDLSIAISEYAPESEVIVNKKKYVSRYIVTKFDDNVLPITKYVTCPQCNRINCYNLEEKIDNCHYCGFGPLSDNPYGSTIRNYIEPKFGFYAEKNNSKKIENTLLPKKTYASKLTYIGEGEKKKELDICNFIKLTQLSNDSLLTINESNFFYCKNCGYTVIDNTNVGGYPTINRPHKDRKGNDCSNIKLDRISLGYKFKTDVVSVEFSKITKICDINFITSYNSEERVSLYEYVYSLLYAILEGICSYLQIDRREIAGTHYFDSNRNVTFIFYDTSSGGSGNISKILDKSIFVNCLKAALTKVSQNCCSEDTSCYNCLRNYYNQSVHEFLKRGKAKVLLNEILSKIDSDESDFNIDDTNNYSVDLSGDSIENIMNNLGETDNPDIIKRLTNIISENANNDDLFTNVKLKGDKGSEIIPDLIWKNKKIVLFNSIKKESYIELKHDTKWHTFIIDENFDDETFKELVGK